MISDGLGTKGGSPMGKPFFVCGVQKEAAEPEGTAAESVERQMLSTA